MSEIKKGDLVMVCAPFKRHCNGPKTPSPDTGAPIKMGHVFRVGRLWHGWTCPRCKMVVEDPSAQPDDGRWQSVSFSRLKKIDPPATGDEVSTRVVRRTPEKHEA